MEIRVRELVDFIKANPSLLEYDAPLALAVESEDESEIKGFRLAQMGGRLVMLVEVTVEGKTCDRCADDLTLCDECELENCRISRSEYDKRKAVKTTVDKPL